MENTKVPGYTDSFGHEAKWVFPVDESSASFVYGATTLYQFKNDYRYIDCGMFYAIQFPDKSFFLIDSAHQNSAKDHIRIHDFLRSLTGENERIHIRGWFFSHAHQDHIVKFMDFIKKDWDDYDIDMLYYNFPDPDGPSSEYWKSDDRVTMREFVALMEERSDLPKTTLHTGDKFTVGTCDFEVLVTWEDIIKDQPLKRFNDSSVVLMMTCGNTRVFWPGDAGEVEADFLVEKYGDALKADILQLAHHGFRGGSVELYNAVNASVVLISTDRPNYEKNKDRETNMCALGLASESYLAGAGTIGIVLK